MARRGRRSLGPLNAKGLLAVLVAAVVIVAAAWQATQHGLWFDEAFVARLGLLMQVEGLGAAHADVHPPGFVLLTGGLSWVGLPIEWALRIPSVLGVGALALMVGWRHPLAGLCVLASAPLMDQGALGRPYALMAALAVLVSHLFAAKRGLAGWTVLALLMSLHALGPVIAVGLIVAYRPWRFMDRRARSWGLATWVILTGWWWPRFLMGVAAYSEAPWYGRSAWADWLWVTDGWLGAAGLLTALVLGARLRPERWRAPLAVGGLLLALQLVGVGVEIAKIGVVLTALTLDALAGGPDGWRSHVGLLALLLGFALSSVTIDARPDLRQAAQVARRAPHVPVVSIFASELAVELGPLHPLGAAREEGDLAERVERVMRTLDVPCVLAVTLPGEAPLHRLDVRRERGITGLDVSWVGHCP